MSAKNSEKRGILTNFPQLGENVRIMWIRSQLLRLIRWNACRKINIIGSCQCWNTRVHIMDELRTLAERKRCDFPILLKHFQALIFSHLFVHWKLSIKKMRQWIIYFHFSQRNCFFVISINIIYAKAAAPSMVWGEGKCERWEFFFVLRNKWKFMLWSLKGNLREKLLVVTDANTIKTKIFRRIKTLLELLCYFFQPAEASMSTFSMQISMDLKDLKDGITRLFPVWRLPLDCANFTLFPTKIVWWLHELHRV